MPTVTLPNSTPGQQTSTSPGIGLPSQSATPTSAPTSGPSSTTYSPTGYPTAPPTSITTTSPTSSPTSTVTTTSSPSPTSTSTSGGVLTVAEATAQCLDQGISALDVAALDACVNDLLAP
jgi:hypothetical protein